MTSPANNHAFQTDDTTLAPVLADLQRIAAMEDGALRNLFITQRYQDISDTTKGVLGSRSLNWCTFACWASKTAGESIRGEELPDFAELVMKHEGFIERLIAKLKALLGFAPATDDLWVFDDVRAVLRGVSAQIALGNLKVYAEIAPLFAHFATELGPSADAKGVTPGPDEAAWQQFAKLLRPGKPDAGDGQDYLRDAFREYYEARFVSDGALRCQKIFYANVLVGLHEQTRLQSAIQSAMDVPAIEGLDELLARAVALRSPGLEQARVAAEVGKIPTFVKQAVIELWERIATRVAMRLALPNGKFVNLGQDVPPVDGRMYPPSLSTLDYAPLLTLGRNYVRDVHSTAGSGATDWSELTQRMNFIFHLFRANAQNAQLYTPPFTSGQHADFNAGRLPSDRRDL